MDIRIWVGVAILLISSMWSMNLGIMSLTGKAKKRYLHSARGAQVPYMAIPISLSLLCFACLMLFSNNDQQATVWVYISTSFFFLGVILSAFQPRFMKPAWLLWLEDCHSDIYPLLVREARFMGLNQWERRVQTQEGLEAWVAEVRAKHNR